MIVMNSSLCSNEFNVAFAALEKGHEIRRASWPDGQRLKMQPSGFVGVVRQGRDFAPPWMGPSNDESDATDWEVAPIAEVSSRPQRTVREE